MYFSFVTRFILVFGIGFLFPVVLVGLNAVGVMPASRLIKGWRVAVVLIFVFAAVATPTADPFTMFVFAAPLTALYFGAWFVCRLMDKRKEKARPDWLDVDDTEASPLRRCDEPTSGVPGLDVRTVVCGAGTTPRAVRGGVDRPAPRPSRAPGRAGPRGIIAANGPLRTSPTRRSAGCRCGPSTSTRHDAWPSRTRSGRRSLPGRRRPLGRRAGRVAFPSGAPGGRAGPLRDL